jgi:hypothetical protein
LQKWDFLCGPVEPAIENTDLIPLVQVRAVVPGLKAAVAELYAPKVHI